MDKQSNGRICLCIAVQLSIISVNLSRNSFPLRGSGSLIWSVDFTRDLPLVDDGQNRQVVEKDCFGQVRFVTNRLYVERPKFIR